MRVKCLAQEHNAVPWPGLEPGPPDPESSALTIRPPRLPQRTGHKGNQAGRYAQAGFNLLKIPFFMPDKCRRYEGVFLFFHMQS